MGMDKLGKLKELRELINGLGGFGFVDQDEDVAQALSILDELLQSEETTEDDAREERLLELLSWRDKPRGLTPEQVAELDALEDWMDNR